jgi:hypothetical protein
MKPVIIPNCSVSPEDFRGRPVACQNLDCQAAIEPPYEVARLSFPGGTLTTVLCRRCMPRPLHGKFPGLRFQVIPAGPVPAPVGAPATLESLGFEVIAFSQFEPKPIPPPSPDKPGIRTSDGPLTFAELAGMEPGLLDLLAEARSHHEDPDPDFCANAYWYGYPGYRPGLKGRLIRLVGMFAEGGGVLRSSEAYDIAYHTIYNALPDCRGRCACTGRFL